MVVVESSILWTAATRWTVRDWMDGRPRTRSKLQVLTAAPVVFFLAFGVASLGAAYAGVSGTKT